MWNELSDDTAAGTESAAFRPEPVDILIVDDEPKNLTVLETVLAEPAYRIVSARSADDALLALISHEFAVLILDIQMPGMTGFELAQMVRKRRKTAHLPIIFLTAYYNEDAHVLEGYDSGAVDYLYKPVNPAVLRSKVFVFAELHRKSREIMNSNLVLNSEILRRRAAEDELRDLNRTLALRVTERTKQLEDRTARLSRANEALEQFAFSTSHDLQEPLRNISIFSGFLKTRYAASLDDEAQMFLATIVEGANRMSGIVSDLLKFVQLDHLDDVPACDSEEVLARVLSNLSTAVQSTGASVCHGALPRVGAKPYHMDLLLQNLIGNAIKYRQAGVAPHVHISALRHDNAWHFAVSDNGIGIDPEYHSLIFGLFKRLHSDREKYDGTGMGLAICQRIVESYAGRIWVESELDRGATFRFTLPAIQ